MITLVYTYYDNGGMLDRHFQEWDSYAPEVKRNFRAVIVDDGSPNDPAIGHMKDPGFPVELYRIKENIPWNMMGARNLGMHVAPEGWCLATDIDHLLTADNAQRLVELMPHIASGEYALLARRWADGRPLRRHPNSYLLERSTYWKCGGADEDYAGWWGGDSALRKALVAFAGQPGFIDKVWLTHYGRDDIPDASTREWGRRGSKWDWAKNPYLVATASGPPYKARNPLRFNWERVWP